MLVDLCAPEPCSTDSLGTQHCANFESHSNRVTFETNAISITSSIHAQFFFSSYHADELFCENNITFRGNLSTISCNKYIYDNTYFDETVVTKFDLICDNEYKKSFLGTVLIMGLLFGSLLGGFIGDKFGRKTANFLALAAIVPFTIGAGHVQSYEGINIMNPNFIVSNFIMCQNIYLFQHMHVYIF